MAVVQLSKRAAAYSGWLVYFGAEMQICGKTSAPEGARGLAKNHLDVMAPT